MFENWIKREPRKTGRSTATDVTKFYFSKNKKEGAPPYGNILIGVTILELLGMNFGDKISLVSNPQNEKQIFIKKSEDGSGYTLSMMGKKNNSSPRFARATFTSWMEMNNLSSSDYAARIVNHELTEGGLLLDIG